MQRALLVCVVLLLSAIAAAATSQQEILRALLLKGQARTTAETFSFSNVVLNKQPRCFVAYLAQPSWSTSSMQLNVALLNATTPQTRECLTRAIRWSPVVADYDDIPASMESSVGWRGSLEGFWSASVQAGPWLRDSTEEVLVTSQDDYDSQDIASLNNTQPINLLKTRNNTGVLECLAEYLPAITGFSSTGGQITFTNAAMDTSAVKNLTACIRNVTGQPPGDPPSPPSSPGKGSMGVKGFVRELREILGLAPFAEPPVFVSDSNPYSDWSGNQPINLTLLSQQAGLYQVQASSCKAGFDSKRFGGLPIATSRSPSLLTSTQPVVTDSCYVTQSLVYIFYDPSVCDEPPQGLYTNITVKATYSPYNLCGTNWMITMGRVMEISIIIVGIPVGIFVFILAAPTAWRLITWPFRHAYVALLEKRGSATAATAAKHRIRMQAGTYTAPEWWQTFTQRPWVAKLLRYRKQLVYACVTIDAPDGHSRLLQVFIIALATVSVTLMVWRPDTKLRLGVNPTRIALQLREIDATDTVKRLTNYVLVVITSIALGCLAYLSTLANINKPGNPYWTLQRILSGACLLYLCAIVILQCINVGAYLPVMHSFQAYSWLIAVQFVNVVGALAIQLAVVLRRTPDSPLGPRASLTRSMELAPPSSNELPQATVSVNPLYGGSVLHNTHTKIAPSPFLQGAAVPDELREDTVTASSHRAKSDLAIGNGASDKPRGLRAAPWRMVKWAQQAVSVWILEETQVYRDSRTGRFITVKLFRYPTWFLSSLLVAFYMLGFHYIKSLVWGKHLGQCVQTPQACHFTFIRQWSTTLGVGQFSSLQAAANSLLSSLTDLKESAPDDADLLDALLYSQTDQGLTHWMAVLNSAALFFTPGTSRISQWMVSVGERMVTVGAVGFTLGVAMGIFTFIWTMASFKAIIKKHRVLKILERLKQNTSDDTDKETSRPAVASLLDKIEQAAAAGTPAAQTLALRASFSHRAQSIETTNSFRRSGSAAYRRNASGAKRDTSLTLATGFPEPTLSAKHTHHPQALDETRVIMPSHMPYTGMQSHKPTLPQLRLADDFARTSSGIDTDNTKGQPRTHKHEIEDPVDVTSVAAVRATAVPLGMLVFFIGVLLSATVLQLYVVGFLLTSVLALVTTHFFWSSIMATYWSFLVAIIVIFLLNRFVIVAWVGNSYVSDGDQVLRPSGWFAFLIITSITNLVLGLFIAITRLIILLLTTLFTIGKRYRRQRAHARTHVSARNQLQASAGASVGAYTMCTIGTATAGMLDRSILSVRSQMDVAYNSFLAGVHLQNSLTNLRDPALLPGRRGKAIRRWRAATHAILRLGVDKYRELEDSKTRHQQDGLERV